jgi:hypothetical protein
MNTHNPAAAFPIPEVRAEHHSFFVSVKSASVTIILPKILLMTRDPQPKTRCLIVPQWCDCCQGKILGFEGKRKGNGEGVAVDLRLPENP